MVKKVQNVNQVKEPVLKTDEELSTKFQTVCTLIWANSENFERQSEQASSCHQIVCPACQVSSRRRIMPAHT